MKKVYMSFSTDILHYGHIQIIENAAKLGELTIGVLTDEVIAQYKKPPLVPIEKRKELFMHLSAVSRVIVKDTVSYERVIREEKPDIIVHGDDWKMGTMSGVREEVLRLLEIYGGELVEFPYVVDDNINLLEGRNSPLYNMPDVRRGMLKCMLKLKPYIRVLEAHNGLTGLIVENTSVQSGYGIKQFDAMWLSSLCDSASRGKPDIELVDWTSKINKINEIMEVTTKPIIVDGDTGGMPEHFCYNVQTLERMGVSAIIIEDKIGLKRNSLFGNEVEQTQDSVENFSRKIEMGKQALCTKDFMIIARIESLILEKGMEDALFRAFAYIKAGADGIMIHSRKRTPDEVFEFCGLLKQEYPHIPIVCVPTTYNDISEKELAQHKIDIIIHANHLLRSAFPAMQETAKQILIDDFSKNAAERMCMPIKDVISFIPVS